MWIALFSKNGKIFHFNIFHPHISKLYLKLSLDIPPNLIIQVMSDDGIIWPFPRFWGLGSNEQSASFWQQHRKGKSIFVMWCLKEGRKCIKKSNWNGHGGVDVCMPTPHRSNNTGGRPNFDHCTVGLNPKKKCNLGKLHYLTEKLISIFFSNGVVPKHPVVWRIFFKKWWF